MPQSTNVTANQMHNIPEQAAEAASVSHDHQTHLSPHEETMQAEDQARNQAEHADKLHHGKAVQQDKK